LEKDRETFKWGDIYHMFKKSNFSTKTKDLDDLQAFRNIRKSRIFRVASHLTIFPCTYSISWILNNSNISSKYVCNMSKEPIDSFILDYLTKCYHIEEEHKSLDGELLNKFEYTPKYLVHKWYKEENQFKYIPKSGYPASALRIPYQYLVSILCKLYGELDVSQFPLSYMPLTY
jgi:hypothetical protein